MSDTPIFDNVFDRLIHDRVREARAQGWDEGFLAGEKDVWMHQMTDDWSSPCIQNPYRRYA